MRLGRQLLRASKAAEKLDFSSTHAFLQAVPRLGIPVTRIGAGKHDIRFDVAELDAWLEAQNPRPGRPLPRRSRANQGVAPLVTHEVESMKTTTSTPREERREIRGHEAVA